jgi:hypothetical protein
MSSYSRLLHVVDIRNPVGRRRGKRHHPWIVRGWLVCLLLEYAGGGELLEMSCPSGGMT